ADRVARFRRGHRTAVEPAVQAEVDVDDPVTLEVVEQVLAVGLGGLEPRAVEDRGRRREPALRRGDRDLLAAEPARVVAREPVDGVALGHDAPRWRPFGTDGSGGYDQPQRVKTNVLPTLQAVLAE